MNRPRLTPAILLLALAAPAFAGSKDTDRIELEIKQLQDAVARLQQSNDERMGVLKDLVQQSADSVNRMSVNMDVMQKQLATGPAANGVKLDQVSGQVQALNDTLDEVKARMARLEKSLADVQGQQQSIAAALQTLPQSNAPAVAQPGTTQSTTVPPAGTLTPANAPAGTPLSELSVPPTPTRRTTPAKSISPPVEELYKSAYSDFMAAKYPVAQSEFNDVIKAYPDNQLSGNSFYYLGEIDYRAGKYSAAAKDYDKVLEQFPDSNKIPASHLHKGQALIEMKQTEAGIREFRALIQRFPTSPEATQARSKLNAMGVTLRPRS